jgi:hypothetical protein
MSKQIKGATRIEDLDDFDQSEILNELDEMMEEESLHPEELDIKPIKKSGSMFSNKVKKISIDTLIVFVLLMAIGNKYTIHYLFKLPFLVKFEGNSWVPITVISVLVCIMFFIIKIITK